MHRKGIQRFSHNRKSVRVFYRVLIRIRILNKNVLHLLRSVAQCSTAQHTITATIILIPNFVASHFYESIIYFHIKTVSEKLIFNTHTKKLHTYTRASDRDNDYKAKVEVKVWKRKRNHFINYCNIGAGRQPRKREKKTSTTTSNT